MIDEIAKNILCDFNVFYDLLFYIVCLWSICNKQIKIENAAVNCTRKYPLRCFEKKWWKTINVYCLLNIDGNPSAYPKMEVHNENINKVQTCKNWK